MSRLKAAIELLRRELRNARVKTEVDFHSMIIGSSSAFLDLFRHLFGDFDRSVSLHLTSNNFFLTGTTDLRFMEMLYRICRDMLKVKPPLSLDQFFTNSFAEKKLRMSAEIVKSVSELKSRLSRRSLAASRMPQKTSAILSSTRSRLTRRKMALCSKSSNLMTRMTAQQNVTRSLTNGVTSSKLLLPPKTDKISQLRADQSIQESEYMSDLMTSLNAISNQISQIVDRVAGIEVRISEIEKPLRNANTDKRPGIVSREDEMSNNPEKDIESKRNMTSTQPDLPQNCPNGGEQNPLLVRFNPVHETKHPNKRTQQPVDALSLSDVDSSMETTDSVSQPVIKKIDRYSPEVTISSSGDGFKMSRSSSTYTKPASHSSDMLYKLSTENFSSYRNHVHYDDDPPPNSKNMDLDRNRTGPIPMDYRSKVLESDDSLGFRKNQSLSYLNNKNDCSAYCNNSNKAILNVDQNLEQQVSRISNMLAETQMLLTCRQPIPHN